MDLFVSETASLFCCIENDLQLFAIKNTVDVCHKHTRQKGYG